MSHPGAVRSQPTVLSLRDMLTQLFQLHLHAVEGVLQPCDNSDCRRFVIDLDRLEKIPPFQK
jgi:hypothetical protein